MNISQCLIVKNEEKNIERALTWGRGVVYEQIVVDTGSTDRTVEIAESLGAKVLSFEWIDDFAAAKNYAIEQASGEWIAFLDADEYMEQTDAQRAALFIKSIAADAERSRRVLAVRCPLVNLTDKGKPSEVYELVRFFRNLPDVRFVGRVHEQINVREKDIADATDFRVMHTGYADEVIAGTGKAERNVALLRAEIARNPKDVNLKAYLAQSLMALVNVKLKMQNEKCEIGDEEREYDGEYSRVEELLNEADVLFREVLGRIRKAAPPLRLITYEFFMDKYSHMPGVDAELEGICARAYKEFPREPKAICYRAMAYNKRGQHREAADVLSGCSDLVDGDDGGVDGRQGSVLTIKVIELYARQMLLAAQGLGDADGVLRNAAVLLTLDKTCIDVLKPYIALLMSRYQSVEKAYEHLAQIYDMSSKRDLLLIAKAAKECGAIELTQRIIDVAAYLGNDNL